MFRVKQYLMQWKPLLSTSYQELLNYCFICDTLYTVSSYIIYKLSLQRHSYDDDNTPVHLIVNHHLKMKKKMYRLNNQ
jgi:hypothetical protein